MSTHHLKTWPEHFQAVKSGDKKAELRVNDRSFQVGDTLILEEYEPGGVEHFYDPSQSDGDGERYHEARYTGDKLEATVTHILHGPDFGLAAGHVMMSLEFEY